MNEVNYQKELEKVIAQTEGLTSRPRLLLHSCCAPCSSYCLVYLRQYFDITCFYYNPNITDEEEYIKRTEELVRLAGELNSDPIAIGIDDAIRQITIVEKDDKYLESVGKIQVIKGDYRPELFLGEVLEKGLEREPEGGKRCSLCFELRLEESCRLAIEKGFDYFTTSLTISPLKNAALLNEIGMRLAEKYDNAVKWLPSDFKKKNGYKMSTQLSERYGLYRQNYCGCDFSK